MNPPVSEVEELRSRRGSNGYRIRADGPSEGRLQVLGGVTRLDLAGAPVGTSADQLAMLEFTDHLPNVTTTRGLVTVRFARLAPLGWLRLTSRPSAKIRLRTRMPWIIELRGGVAGLDADFRGVALRGVDIDGGLSNAKLRLPRPPGTILVRVHRGASGVSLQVPAGTPVRVRISGAATGLDVLGTLVGATGTGWSWATPDWDSADERYDIAFDSSVAGLTVTATASG